MVRGITEYVVEECEETEDEMPTAADPSGAQVGSVSSGPAGIFRIRLDSALAKVFPLLSLIYSFQQQYLPI